MSYNGNIINEVTPMSKTSNMYIRIDSKAKSEIDPRPSTPNAETAEAIREGDKIIRSSKGCFDNADDLLRELKSDADC